MLPVSLSFAQEVAPPPLPDPTVVSPQAAQDANALQPVNEADIEADVLTRGPVHEAYAEQYTPDPTEGIVVPKSPPEPISELPPEEMPEGANVEWIPGYWAWEEDIEDFIWISGLWRDIPIGQRWVPGYWANVEEGYRWVPGFWHSEEAEELAYLPEPPQSLDQGPNVAAPTQDHFWVPGNWVYQSNNYAWQPGYWTLPYNDYVWVPSRYQWTPRGYVFCSGYWDYPVFRRGVLFSPVRFRNRRVPYRYYGYRYRPSLVVSTGPLLVHLFVRPRYRHYYFGDYYAPRYRNRGIYPFTQLNVYLGRNRSYDPIRTYYQHRSRQLTYNRLVDWNRYFDRHEGYRPPHTLALTRQFNDRNRSDQNRLVLQQATLSEAISELSKPNRPDHRDFRRISAADRDRISDRASSAIRQLTDERVKFERFSRSPKDDNSIAGRPGDRGRGPDARDDSDRRGPGNRPDGDNNRDRDRREITSLKLPQIDSFRNRLDGRGDSSFGRDRNPATRDADNDRSRPGSIGNRDGDRGNGRVGDDRERDTDDRRFSRNYSPDDLRKRIEAAQGRGDRNTDSQGPAGDRNRDSNQDLRDRIDAARRGMNTRPTERDANGRDRSTENRPGENTDIRSRIEAARKAAEDRSRDLSGKARPEMKPTENRGDRNSSPDRGTRESNSSSNDLRARIEAARKAAEERNRGRTPSAQPERKPSGNRNEKTTTPEAKPSSSTNDIRARIEAARKAAEERNRGRTPSAQPERKPTDNRNERTATPETRSSSSSNDLRARIEAARKAADQRRNERESVTPRQPERSNRSTPSSSNDLRERIEQMRRSSDRNPSSSTRTRPTSQPRSAPRVERNDSRSTPPKINLPSRTESRSNSVRSTPQSSRSSSKGSSSARSTPTRRSPPSRSESSSSRSRSSSRERSKK